MLALPALGVRPGADLRQDRAHGAARLLRDDARAGGVVAVLGGIAHGVAHEPEAAAVHQVHDELELVQALEVRHLRLVARLDERLEAGGHERADAAAQHGLLAEQIRLRLLRERRLDDARAGAAERLGIGERERPRAAARVGVDGDQRRRAGVLEEHLADAVAGGLGRDHRHVHALRHLDPAEADREAVREEQQLAGPEVRCDGLRVEPRLLEVRRQDHDEIRPGRCRGRRHRREAVGFRRLPGAAARPEAHADIHAAVPQVERVGVALGSVSDDRDPLRSHEVEIRVSVVNHHHSIPPPRARRPAVRAAPPRAPRCGPCSRT